MEFLIFWNHPSSELLCMWRYRREGGVKLDRNAVEDMAQLCLVFSCIIMSLCICCLFLGGRRWACGRGCRWTFFVAYVAAAAADCVRWQNKWRSNDGVRRSSDKSGGRAEIIYDRVYSKGDWVWIAQHKMTYPKSMFRRSIFSSICVELLSASQTLSISLIIVVRCH